MSGEELSCVCGGNFIPASPDTLPSLQTLVPPASLGEGNLATSPDPVRAWILGQLNSSLQEKGGSTIEKTSNYRNKDTALALAGG